MLRSVGDITIVTMKRRNFLKAGPILGLTGVPFYSLADRPTQLKENSLNEPSQNIPVSGEYDVIVSGAGPAGIAAAIEAGRSGAKTLLLEVRGCLGGVWTAGLLSWILDQANKPGLMRELENRLEQMGAKSPIDTGARLAYDVEKMKLLLELMCAESNVDVILHTRVVAAVKTKNQQLSHVVTESKSGREAWAGKVFIDTSGDGDLAALSGCGFDFGDPKNGAFQPMSLLALISGVQFEEIKSYVRWQGDTNAASKKLLLEELVSAGVLPSYTKPSIFPIYDDLFMIMANHEYGFSGLDTRAVTKATLQARAEIHTIINGLQSLGGRWKNIRLIATAEHIGVREGRRIHGMYTVNTDDLIKGVRHDDAVCRVTFGVDVHSVSRSEDNIDVGYNRGIKVKPYDIPLRALIAKDVGGLMMAGRCISGDFIAHSSYRVTGNAVTMGQAVGRVGAVAVAKKKLPQSVTWNETGLAKLDK